MADFNNTNLADFSGVWVFCEQRQGELQPTVLELISEARKLADDMGTEVCGLLLGGKNTLKVGAMGGTVIVSFMKMETDADLEAFIALSQTIIDWWNDNGFDHERVGETIERVGLKQFLDGVGLQASIDMVTRPRSNPYYKSEY